MQDSKALDLTFVEATDEVSISLREQVLTAWQSLLSRYNQSDTPEIFSRYYGGASERVSAAEPLTSFKKIMP